MDAERIVAKFISQGWEATDLTQNELAKTHGRFMIGIFSIVISGGQTLIPNEHIYRVSIIEHSGAILGLIAAIDRSINVTLFNYRNHGGNVGRLLIGISTSDNSYLEDFMRGLKAIKGIDIVDETDNKAYSDCLKCI